MIPLRVPCETVVPEAILTKGYVEGATAVSKREQNPLDLRFVGEYKVTTHIQLTAGASVELSHSSPAFTALAGLDLRF
jgi:hypothetical protein